MTPIGKGIHRSLQQLIKSGDLKEPKELYVPKMQTFDLWDVYKHKLSDKAVLDVEQRKSGSLLYEYDKPLSTDRAVRSNFAKTIDRLNLSGFEPDHSLIFYNVEPNSIDGWISAGIPDRAFFQTNYIGVTVEENGSIEDGVDFVLDIIEELSELDHIKGNLTELLAVSLADGRTCIVSYLLFDEEGNEFLKKNRINHSEGATPEDL